MTRTFTALALLAAFAGTTFTTPAAAQPSFNCKLARTPDEIVICRTPVLQKRDRELAAVYTALRNRLTGAARAKLDADEAGWVKARGGCGSDPDCIEAAYDDQISLLQDYKP